MDCNFCRRIAPDRFYCEDRSGPNQVDPSSHALGFSAVLRALGRRQQLAAPGYLWRSLHHGSYSVQKSFAAEEFDVGDVASAVPARVAALPDRTHNSVVDRETALLSALHDFLHSAVNNSV